MFSLRRISSQSVRRAGLSLLLRSMASQIIQVPKMGDSITEGTLIKTVKQLGERVALDEVVCVIETDKVRSKILLYYYSNAKRLTFNSMS